jgi:GPH family glycoside/pentoside/hexuronide:cation symporter
MEQNKLSLGKKLGYGAADLGNNLFVQALGFVLLIYLTDTVGLSAALAGTALMIGRIWDAFYDPVIGYLSDRSKTRMGRRRPFMLGGAIPWFIAMVVMFTNPSLVIGSGISQAALFAYALIVYMVLCTAYSTVNVPYYSWAPELTSDYHERTSLNGYRSGFAFFGNLIALGAALPIVALSQNKSLGFVLMGLIFGGVMLITTLTTVFAIREPAELKPAKSMDIWKTYLAVFKNRPYVLILLAYIINFTGITIISGIAIYYFKYILRAENMVTYAMLLLLVTSVVFIPVSVVIAKKTGKKLVYGAASIITAASVMMLFFFGHTLGLNFALVMMFFLGIGLGFTYVPPFAMVADAIEYDYLVTGERREGAFFGIWTWGIKLGQALAVFLMGVILEAMGYVANAMPQSPSAELGIRLFLGPISAVIFVASAVVLYFYPITEKRYKEILAGIEERDSKKA